MRSQPVPYLRSLTLLGMTVSAAYLLGLALVVWWSFGDRASLGVFRFAPFTLLVLPLGLAALLDTPFRRTLALSLIRNRWLTLLCIYMMAGGLYTRFGPNGSAESFFTHSLAMLSFFFIWSFATRANPVSVAAPLLRASFPFWVVMLGVVMYGFMIGKHMAHEIMYVITPLPIFFGLQAKTPLGRLAAFLMIAVIAGLGLKNTTLIIGALSCYLMWVFNNPEVRTGARRPFTLQSALLLSLVVMGGLYAHSLLESHVADFSSGNTDFRKYNYAKLWQTFLSSPIYGGLFLGTPNLTFDLYTIDVGTQNLPSHSDVLDILAHGGAIGMGLFVLFLGSLARNFLKTYADSTDPVEYATRVTLFVTCVSAVFTCCVNPCLGNVNNAFLFWSSMGLCAAITNPQRKADMFAGDIAGAGLEIESPYLTTPRAA